jgi:5-methylcytosine-specific restriction endonuclease McrA
MPALRICAARGCGQKTRETYCATHTATENKRRNTHTRRQVYDNSLWRRTRKIVLARDEFTCTNCGFYSPTGRHLVADHDTPVLDIIGLGRNPFDPDECSTLCLTCSGRKDGARGTSYAAVND